MAEGNVGPSKRFVPSGVDAQSWMGFEHRIQERRFKALIDTIRNAIAQGDGVAARVALEEARELRPDAPEVGALAARVALLPARVPVSASSAYFWYRGASAVAMFAVGIGLVIGIESFRPSTPHAAPVSVVASARPPAEAMPAPTSAPDVLPAPTPAATVSAPAIDAPVSVEDPPAAAAATIDTRGEIDTRREEPVGTAGVPRASADVRRADVPNRATFRPEVDAEPVVSASREIPDDYVATGARSEGRPGHAEITSPGPAIAANVMPQPVSIIAPPAAAPVLPASPAAGTASTVAPRSDNSRVAQVLNQYARAYDQLDPGAARAVWPTVDERALTRAFSSLESQDVSFERCDIDVKGNLASASCRGTASYVGKIGNRQARTEPRQWSFELKLHGDDWKIEKAEAYAR